MSATLERTQLEIIPDGILPARNSIMAPPTNGHEIPVFAPAEVHWHGCIGEHGLAKRADIAIQSLEPGDLILNLGTDVIHQIYQRNLTARGINIIDISSSTYLKACEKRTKFDLAFGNLDSGFDLKKAFEEIHTALKPGADMYIDVYENPTVEKPIGQDELDTIMQDAGFYVQESEPARIGMIGLWAVRGIATEAVDPANLPYRIKPRFYKTGQEWEIQRADSELLR